MSQILHPYSSWPMGILDSISGLFKSKGSERFDLSKRFRLERHALTGTRSKFHVAHEIATGKVYGIKLLDKEK
ncbi:MAG: hypothetical protein ACKO9H_00225, partial [Planctomycetota bacterium]